ncbi:MAG: glycosyltransferase family 4 protein [Myxococcota bacterium]|nr:glycosyltransferase family 4 protein [Myxococcota bacterium]
MLDILHIACFPYPSIQGSQVYVRGLLKALAKRGHRVRLLCYQHGTELLDDEYEVIRARGLPGYNNMRAGPDFCKPLLDVFLLKRLLTLRADIIHVHNYEAPIAGLIRQLRGRIPMVYTAHNLMGEELETYFQSGVIRRIASGFGLMLDKAIPRRADAVIAIREDTVETLRDLGCERVRFVPPGVERLQAEPKKNDRPTVVYAGNLDTYQDLELIRTLAQRLPEVSFSMITSSDPTDVRNWGLPNVIIHHTQSFSDVCNGMASADVGILPRKRCSGYPMKVLNYLALGIPVVAWREGCPDLLGVKRVSNGSILDFEKEIRYLIQNPDVRRLRGQAGLNEVLTKYRWESCAIEVEKIYNFIINRSNGRKSWRRK